MPDYLQNHPLTTGYAVYREHTRSSFALLDSIQHPNLHRVYPHEYQIEGRCVTHITEKLFYRDSDHVNQFGARMINDLIMERSGWPTGETPPSLRTDLFRPACHDNA